MNDFSFFLVLVKQCFDISCDFLNAVVEQHKPNKHQNRSTGRIYRLNWITEDNVQMEVSFSSNHLIPLKYTSSMFELCSSRTSRSSSQQETKLHGNTLQSWSTYKTLRLIPAVIRDIIKIKPSFLFPLRLFRRLQLYLLCSALFCCFSAFVRTEDWNRA